MVDQQMTPKKSPHEAGSNPEPKRMKVWWRRCKFIKAAVGQRTRNFYLMDNKILSVRRQGQRVPVSPAVACGATLLWADRLAGAAGSSAGATAGVATGARAGCVAATSSFLLQALRATASKAAASRDLFMKRPFNIGCKTARSAAVGDKIVSALPVGKRLFMMLRFRKS